VEFVNKVAESGIITIDLATYMPKQEIVSFDLKDYLFMGLILKEKDYREALKNLDVAQFKNKIVAVHCSADAIIPQWAYMLAASRLYGHAHSIAYGNVAYVREQLTATAIAAIEVTEYTDTRIVVKGCGDDTMTASAYLNIANKLLPVVKSLMYGEPCSTVPIYKKKA
jgi:hypothetical protein